MGPRLKFLNKLFFLVCSLNLYSQAPAQVQEQIEGIPSFKFESGQLLMPELLQCPTLKIFFQDMHKS